MSETVHHVRRLTYVLLPHVSPRISLNHSKRYAQVAMFSGFVTVLRGLPVGAPLEFTVCRVV
jgi:hypothetical protein